MSEITISFDSTTQDIGPLREAAYRLIGVCSCKIDRIDGRYECHLIPASGTDEDARALHRRFLDVVNDENLRDKISRQTAPVRDLILALAFGALINPEQSNES